MWMRTLAAVDEIVLLMCVHKKELHGKLSESKPTPQTSCQYNII